MKKGFLEEDIKLLANISGYSYVDNKMSEIKSVNNQAEQWEHQLNLFINPHLAKALIEVLQAKQKQIDSSLKRNEISSEEFHKLVRNLEDVRRNIARLTSTNTVHATRLEARKAFRLDTKESYSTPKKKKRNSAATLHRFSLDRKFKQMYHLDNLFHSILLQVWNIHTTLISVGIGLHVGRIVQADAQKTSCSFQCSSVSSESMVTSSYSNGWHCMSCKSKFVD